jgi:hypothetical protein
MTRKPKDKGARKDFYLAPDLAAWWETTDENRSKLVNDALRRILEKKTMHIYEVGKLYTERTHWPELAQYNYRGGEHELVLFFNHPTPEEIHDVARGEVSFALYERGAQIVMLYRFGQALPWSDAPYSIHLVPTEERVLPPETAEGAEPLHVVLVNAATGIIAALRAIAIPQDFLQVLYAAIHRQAALPFTRAIYNGELESLFARYDSAALAGIATARFFRKPEK